MITRLGALVSDSASPHSCNSGHTKLETNWRPPGDQTESTTYFKLHLHVAKWGGLQQVTNFYRP